VDPVHPLKNILVRFLWDKNIASENYDIEYINRDGKDNTGLLKASSLNRVGNSWFTFMREGEETFIPFHRITVIKNLKTGEILWRGRKASRNIVTNPLH